MKYSLVRALLFLGVIGHAAIAMAQSSGTFTATGDLTAPRHGHTATLLTNGRILIAGGYIGEGGNGNNVLASAELYDPSTGTFTATGDMTRARANHTDASGVVATIGLILRKEKLLQTLPAQLNFERRRPSDLFDECVKYDDNLRRRRVVKHPVDAILTPNAKFGYPGSYGWYR